MNPDIEIRMRLTEANKNTNRKIIIKTTTEELVIVLSVLLFVMIFMVWAMISLLQTKASSVAFIDDIFVPKAYAFLLYIFYTLIFVISLYPSRYQIKYFGGDSLIFIPTTYSLSEKIKFEDILAVSFVTLIYTPIVQFFKKKIYSDKAAVIICYKKKNKIKRLKLQIYLDNVDKVRDLFKEKGITVVPSRIFMGYSYNCKKLALHYFKT